jgi:hypothetical protein
MVIVAAILVQFEIDRFVCTCGIGRSTCTCELGAGSFRNGRESATAYRKSRTSRSGSESVGCRSSARNSTRTCTRRTGR